MSISGENGIKYIKGDRVVVRVNDGEHNGIIRWEGNILNQKDDVIRQQSQMQNFDGIWIGIELNDAIGNFGTTSYFTCKPKHGIFCRETRILGFVEKTRGHQKYSRFAAFLLHSFPIVNNQLHIGLSVVQRMTMYLKSIATAQQQYANQMIKITESQLLVEKTKSKDLNETKQMINDIDGMDKYVNVMVRTQKMVLQSAQGHLQCARNVIDQVVEPLLHYCKTGELRRKQYAEEHSLLLDKISKMHTNIQKEKADCLRIHKQMKDAELEYSNALVQLTELQQHGDGSQPRSQYNDVIEQREERKIKTKITQRFDKLRNKTVQAQQRFTDFKYVLEHCNSQMEKIYTHDFVRIFSEMEELETKRLDELKRGLALFASLHAGMLGPLKNSFETVLNSIHSVKTPEQLKIWVSKQRNNNKRVDPYPKIVYDLPAVPQGWKSDNTSSQTKPSSLSKLKRMATSRKPVTPVSSPTPSLITTTTITTTSSDSPRFSQTKTAPSVSIIATTADSSLSVSSALHAMLNEKCVTNAGKPNDSDLDRSSELHSSESQDDFFNSTTTTSTTTTPTVVETITTTTITTTTTTTTPVITITNTGNSTITTNNNNNDKITNEKTEKITKASPRFLGSTKALNNIRTLSSNFSWPKKNPQLKSTKSSECNQPIECVRAIKSTSSDDPNMMNYHVGDVIVIVDRTILDKNGRELWKGQLVRPTGCLDSLEKLFEPSNVEKLTISTNMPLGYLLQIPMGIFYFTNHLCQEYSQENISFWIEVRDWQYLMEMFISEENHDALFRKAQGIYKQYIARNATDQVNICSTNRANISRQLDDSQATQELDPELFAAVHLEIFKLLQDDSFKRFRLSQDFELFLADARKSGLTTEESKSNTHND